MFVVIRIDAEESRKILLPSGKHLLGRGQFLDCDDKRISRKHAELQVTNDAVAIKSLHQNPCFYIKEGTDETQVLQQNEIINLSNGDKFGLLPSSHWYELILKQSTDEPSSVCSQPEIQSQVYEDTECVEDAQINSLSYVNNTVITKGSPSLVQNGDEIDDRSESPSLLATLVENCMEAEKCLPEDSEQNDNPNSPKRSHSPDTDNVKKIKTESDVKQEPPDAQAGSSNDAGSSNNGPNLPPSPVKPNNAAVGRERCIYGTRCYRKNPLHKAEFSHPGDADYGTGERGVCPRGATCARRDPRHWAAHSHPPGTHPPQARHGLPGGKKRKKQAEIDQGSPDVDIGLLVEGKRNRKTVKRDYFSDSESENEDPFKTDGSEDEWEPNDTETQETQDFTQDF